MENMKYLQSNIELMKKQICTHMKVYEENSTLKLESEKIEEEVESIKVKIKETENIENAYASELEKIETSIEEMENKKSTLITKREAIKEKVIELEKEMDYDKKQHQLQRYCTSWTLYYFNINILKISLPSLHRKL